MEKISKFRPLLGMVFLMAIGCAAPQKLVEKTDTITTQEVNVYNDTVITHLIKTVTIWKVDTSGLRIDISSKEQKVTKGRQANRKDSVSKQKEIESDNLTPKLKKLDSRAVNDSLKGELKLKKQDVKQVRLEHRNEFMKLVIYLVAMIITGAIVIKTLGLFKK